MLTTRQPNELIFERAVAELAQQSPLIHGLLQTLHAWKTCLSERLENDPDGCPVGFLPHTHINSGAFFLVPTQVQRGIDDYNRAVPTLGTTGRAQPSLLKYRTILEPDNHPFDTRDRSALPVRRLWAFLVRQEQLMHSFIRHVFRKPQDAYGNDVNEAERQVVVSSETYLPC